MSDNDITKNAAPAELDPQAVKEVSGGLDLCSPQELLGVSEALRQTYDNLVDFTSYVIERVAGK